ncbi:MAG: hypothetical protein ACE365_00040 [Gammaproteobacteria bacterium]
MQNKIKLIVAILIIVVIIFLGYLFVPKNMNSDKSGLKAAYKQWTTAVTTAKGNPISVKLLYSKDAVLLPTLSNDLLFKNVEIGEKDIGDYFIKFTSLPDLSVSTKELISRTYGDNVGTNVGFYTFSYTKNGKTIKLPARFSFVYLKDKNGDWKIIEHHSSVVPE